MANGNGIGLIKFFQPNEEKSQFNSFNYNEEDCKLLCGKMLDEAVSRQTQEDPSALPAADSIRW